MCASRFSSARATWLNLVAIALALTVWGATLLSAPQPTPDLAQRPNAALQLADGGGAKPNG